MGADQWAFSSHGLHPMPKPRKTHADWLAVESEHPQPLRQFMKNHHTIPHSTYKTIYIFPFGEFDEGVGAPSLKKLATLVSLHYQLPVKVLRSLSVEGVEVNLNEFGDAQYDGSELLRVLQKSLTREQCRHQFCVMGVTMHDIFHSTAGHFVAGLGSMVDEQAGFSFHRGHPQFYSDGFDYATVETCEEERALIFERAAKVLVHELGHVFGLRHCVYYLCNMNGANHLGEVSRTPVYHYPVCLRKLHSSWPLDHQLRCEQLMEFWRESGFEEHAMHYQDRLAIMQGDGDAIGEASADENVVGNNVVLAT